MATEAQQEAAGAVEDAVRQLNRALSLASAAGLMVRLDTSEAQLIGQPAYSVVMATCLAEVRR